jgi:hypothetical protein
MPLESMRRWPPKKTRNSDACRGCVRSCGQAQVCVWSDEHGLGQQSFLSGRNKRFWHKDKFALKTTRLKPRVGLRDLIERDPLRNARSDRTSRQ